MFKIKKYISIELFVIFFWALMDLIQVLVILNTHILLGDFFPWEVTVSNTTIIFLFLSQFLLYLFVYKFYVSFIKGKRLIKSNLNLNKHLYKFIDYFLLSLLVLNIVFFASGVISTAGTYKPRPESFIINIVSIDAVFPIYYFLNRDKNNRTIYVVNIIVYILLCIIRGWSGIFLFIFFFELYFQSKGKISLKFLLLLPLFLIGGIVLYQFIYPLKMAIRYNTTLEPISFVDAASLLIGRLSMMGNLIAIFQYKSDILYLLNSMYPLNFAILKFIRIQIPSFISIHIFPYNIFLYGALGHILWLFKIGYLPVNDTEQSSFGVPLLGTLYLLLLRNPIELILYILFTVFIVFYIKIILDIFGNKDIYFPFFLTLIYFVHESGEVQVAFGRLFFSLTSFFFVMLFAKAILYTLKDRPKREVKP